MENICDLKLETITESSWIRLVQVKYTQNKIEKKRDVTLSHNSCGILIHNISRNVFVFVRQFRPAVFMHEFGWQCLPVNAEKCVNIENEKLQKGFTIELCAGIIDKDDKSVAEIAALEVLEECGYKVEAKDLEPIITARNNSYFSGTTQNMFYARVTDDMKMEGWGGGVEEEGEFIQIIEVSVNEVIQTMFEDYLPKPVALTFALVWFCYTKASSSLSLPPSFSLTMKHNLTTISSLSSSLTDSRIDSSNDNENNNFKKRPLSPEKIELPKKNKSGCHSNDIIRDVTITDIKRSDELQLYRLHYSQKQMIKTWDFFYVKSACAVLVHNVTRDVFVLVRKFSPAIYASIHFNEQKRSGSSKNNLKPNTACQNQLLSTFYGSDEQPCNAASDMIRRVLGYKVCSQDFQKILNCRSNVGTAGALLTLLYVKVTDEMKNHPEPDQPTNNQQLSPDHDGGTLGYGSSDNNILDVIEVPVFRSKNNKNASEIDGLTIALTDKDNPLSLSLSLLWFYLKVNSQLL